MPLTPPVSSNVPLGPAGGDLAGSFPNPDIAAGVIVNADIAAGAAIAASKLDLSGYQPNIDRIQLAAWLGSIVGGTRTEILVGAAGNKWPALSFADSVATTFGYVFSPPPHWLTYNIFFYWGGSGSAGNVTWVTLAGSVGDGDSFSMATIMSATAITAAANNVIKRSAGGTGVAVSQGKLHEVQVQRLGADAGDTLGAAVGLVAIELIRAT